MWFRYSWRKIAELFANSGDPDQMPHSVASDLGLHCLPITLLGVSRLQWVKVKKAYMPYVSEGQGWPVYSCSLIMSFTANN